MKKKIYISKKKICGWLLEFRFKLLHSSPFIRKFKKSSSAFYPLWQGDTIEKWVFFSYFNIHYSNRCHMHLNIDLLLRSWYEWAHFLLDPCTGKKIHEKYMFFCLQNDWNQLAVVPDIFFIFFYSIGVIKYLGKKRYEKYFF